jgi:uncharacterized protein with PIN domain
MAESSLGQRTYKMSLVLLKRQKVRKCSKETKKMLKGCQSNTGAYWKTSRWPKMEQYKKEDKVALNYNPKYKTNMDS